MSTYTFRNRCIIE